MLPNQAGQYRTLRHAVKPTYGHPGCGEGKCSVYCGVLYKETGTAVLKKPELPDGFQGSLLRAQVREGSHRVCDELGYNSLIG